MDNLLRELRSSALGAPGEAPAGRRFLPDAPFVGGLETRTPADDYFWDGMRRGGDPSRPFVVFQVTLNGAGMYEDAAGRYSVGPGRAFAAVVPGGHRYYLPPPSGGSGDAPTWTFFYLLVRHPYVVERIAARQRAAGTAVLDVAENSIVVARAAALLTGNFPDRWAEEEALLQFALAYDRHVARAAPEPAERRERLLEETRRFVLDRLDRPVDVSELAAAQGMSRSRFSHFFHDVTGESPARYMARVRLEEAGRRLVQTDDTLARIAADTGFADANHLCRVFRRHFRISPGAFRRQVR